MMPRTSYSHKATQQSSCPPKSAPHSRRASSWFIRQVLCARQQLLYSIAWLCVSSKQQADKLPHLPPPPPLSLSPSARIAIICGGHRRSCHTQNAHDRQHTQHALSIHIPLAALKPHAYIYIYQWCMNDVYNIYVLYLLWMMSMWGALRFVLNVADDNDNDDDRDIKYNIECCVAIRRVSRGAKCTSPNNEKRYIW